MSANGIYTSPVPLACRTPTRRGWWRTILADLACLTLLAAVSLAVGVWVNGTRLHPLPWSYRSPAQRLQELVLNLQASATPGTAGTPLAVTASTPVDLEAFQAFVSQGKGTVIDARAAEFYQQGHVPGALSLPRETFAADYMRVKGRLESRRAGGIIVYCSEADCPDAATIAGVLARLSYEHVRVYPGGWEEWSHAGLPVESTPKP